MNLSIWCRDNEFSDRIRAYAASKADKVFSRYENRLLGGEMRIEHKFDSGEPVARCSLDLKSVSHGIIHVEELDENAFAAISKTIRVAQEKLKRTSERRKVKGRKRGRFAKALCRDPEEDVVT